MSLTGQHAISSAALPWLHKDPFDRLLIAQAMVEGLTLITLDQRIASYSGPIRAF